MHIDRQVGAAADLGGHLDHADAPAREAADLGMRLDAADQIAVRIRRLDGRIDIDAIRAVEIRIIMTFQTAHEIGRQKRIGARQRFFGDEVPKARQGHAGRTALIHQGCHARPHADHVGVHTETSRDILIDMRVGIDQAGQHDLAGDVDDFAGAGRQDVGLDGCDLAAANGDILQPVHAGRRIDDPSATQQQVE